HPRRRRRIPDRDHAVAPRLRSARRLLSGHDGRLRARAPSSRRRARTVPGLPRDGSTRLDLPGDGFGSGRDGGAVRRLVRPDADGSMRPRLRVAVQKARDASVPVENIKRAIDRGTGAIEGAAYEEIVYEGKGPGGSAIVLECYSENRNRTVAEIRHAFTKNGG